MSLARKYVITALSFAAVLLLSAAAAVVYIDPVFHYHKPLEGAAYLFYEGERYINDGITRNFDYDAVITGTSMTENFKPSECDAVFGVTSIKVPFAGAHYKEINENLKKAFQTDHTVRMVIRCMDTFTLIDDKDAQRQEDYPVYLTDESLINDVRYILNKEMVYHAFLYAAYGKRETKTVDLDNYAGWESAEYGREYVLNHYQRHAWIENAGLTEREINLIKENVNQNIISTIEENPGCTFYLFFQPSSVLYYDYLFSRGEFYKIWQGQQLAAQKLLEYKNVKLFGWADRYELTADLNEYRDMSHYRAHVNSRMLQWMADGTGLLTKQNQEAYFHACISFYENYDYDALFEEQQSGSR